MLSSPFSKFTFFFVQKTYDLLCVANVNVEVWEQAETDKDKFLIGSVTVPLLPFIQDGIPTSDSWSVGSVSDFILITFASDRYSLQLSPAALSVFSSLRSSPVPRAGSPPPAPPSPSSSSGRAAPRVASPTAAATRESSASLEASTNLRSPSSAGSLPVPSLQIAVSCPPLLTDDERASSRLLTLVVHKLRDPTSCWLDGSPLDKAEKEEKKQGGLPSSPSKASVCLVQTASLSLPLFLA